MEFLPVLDLLTQKSTASNGAPISFNVVVPSLPGFAFSDKSNNPKYSLDDTARIFDVLMTKYLGYPKYAVHGTSNGAILAFTLYDKFNSTTRAAHFPLLPFASITDVELLNRKVVLTPIEENIHDRAMEWTYNGTAYYSKHIYQVGANISFLSMTLTC